MDLLALNESIRRTDFQNPKDERFTTMLCPRGLKMNIPMVAALKVDEVTAPATEDFSGTTDVCFP
jgi:hypothetical protein